MDYTVAKSWTRLSDFHFHFLHCRQILYHLSHQGSPPTTTPSSQEGG